MTETRNAGILLVTEEKYRSVVRRTGALGVGVGILLVAALPIGFTIGEPFQIAAIWIALLGAVTAITGVITIMIAGQFPHVSKFGSWVSSTISSTFIVGILGAIATAVLSGDPGVGVPMGFLIVLVTLTCAMLAWANRVVLRTAAALIEPAEEPGQP